MSQIWAVTLKELKIYFVSPIAYIVTAMFLLISGYFFSMILAYSKDAGMMRYLFANMGVMLLLLCPLFSMRLFAEEQKHKTLELLMTAPITEARIVLGKFLATALLLLLMLCTTVHYPLALLLLGKPELGPIVSGYLGVFLLGCAFLGIGMLTSTWTQNQLIAAALSFALSLLLWFSGATGSLAGAEIGAILTIS